MSEAFLMIRVIITRIQKASQFFKKKHVSVKKEKNCKNICKHRFAFACHVLQLSK